VQGGEGDHGVRVPKMVQGKCALHEKRVRVQFFSGGEQCGGYHCGYDSLSGKFWPFPQTAIAYRSLLRELVLLLGTCGASRGSSTTYVVLRRCTYLVGAHALRAQNFFLVPGYWYTIACT
jgi:hypothetical protein